jgi:hypothetical protein
LWSSGSHLEGTSQAESLSSVPLSAIFYIEQSTSFKGLSNSMSPPEMQIDHLRHR